ncbi:HEAT repeat domain-containing protein [Chloroflexota bacterium]
MLIIINTIIILQGLIILILLGLIVRRLLIGYWSRYLKSRQNRFEPTVLNLLEDPENITPLARGLRPFDRGLIEETLLQQADELKGEERTTMTAVFERLDYVTEEINNLSSSRWWRRRDAAIKLGIMQSEKASPTLIQAIADPNEEVRLAAVRALGQMRDLESITTLLNILEKRADWTSGRILEILIGLGDLIKKPVLPWLTSTTNPRVKLLLVQLCGLMRWSEVIPLLIPLLEDRNTEIRVSAAQAIGNIGGDITTAEHLVSMLIDENWEVRAQAAETLGLLQDVRILNQLKQCLSDENWQVRYNAAKAVFQLGKPGETELDEICRGPDSIAAGIAAQAVAEGRLGL